MRKSITGAINSSKKSRDSIALRAQLCNLEDTIAALLQPALAQPEDERGDHLMDKVSEPDSIADVTRQALEGMDEDGTGRPGLPRSSC